MQPSDHMSIAAEYGRPSRTSRLDVRVHSLTFVACGAEVDDLDDWTLKAITGSAYARHHQIGYLLLQKNVLGLQVAMYQLRLPKQCQTVN